MKQRKMNHKCVYYLNISFKCCRRMKRTGHCISSGMRDAVSTVRLEYIFDESISNSQHSGHAEFYRATLTLNYQFVTSLTWKNDSKISG